MILKNKILNLKNNDRIFQVFLRLVLYSTLLVLLFSCSHKQYNGDYVLKNHEWVFVPRKISLSGYMKNRQQSLKNLKMTGELIWPVREIYEVSSGYGSRHGDHHNGIDIPAPRGTMALASMDGEVIYAGRMRGYGRMIVLKHKHPKDDLPFHTVYAHNSANLVKVGMIVKQGQEIAKIGNTGRSSGPHLHFEVRENNRAIDPLQFFEEDYRIAKVK